MDGLFRLHRSAVARQQAAGHVEVSAEKIADLVALATSLADRTEAMPSLGVERDRDRRERVLVLRRAAEAGQRTLDARDQRERRGAHQDAQRHASG